jgi:purine-binding chemotaxis protein CheW
MASALAHAAGGGEVLTFRIASETLGLPAQDIAEVIRMPAVIRVPHGPPSLLGVANLRGTVLPIVSLATMLGHEAGTETARSRVVVVAGHAPVGLLVDAVTAFAKADQAKLLDFRALLDRDFGTSRRRGASRTDRQDIVQVADVPDAGRDEIAMIGLKLAGREYALPLDKVAEVIRVPGARVPGALAEVPRTDNAMMGAIALRHALLPLVSLRVLLGLPLGDVDRAAARIVVTSIGNINVGLMVDVVTSILRVASTSIDPVPSVLTRGTGEAQIEGICRLDGGQRLVCLLSPARLLDAKTETLIQSQAQSGSQSEPASMTGVTAPNISSHEGAHEQFLIFQLGDEHYGLPVAAVDEVVRRPASLVRLPRAPAFVEGVMNLRGRVVPVIDQRQRFAVGGETTLGRRVIVVTMDGLQAGFAVDAVSEVLSVSAAELQPAPEFDTGAVGLFDRVAIKTGGQMILLISPKALLDQAERDLLASLSETAAAS